MKVTAKQFFLNEVERIFVADADVIEGFAYEAYQRHKCGEDSYDNCVFVSHLGFENVSPRFIEEREMFSKINRFPVMWGVYNLTNLPTYIPDRYYKTVRDIVKKLSNAARVIIGQTRCMFGNALTTVAKLSEELQLSETTVKKGLEQLFKVGILKERVSIETRLQELTINELKVILKSIGRRVSGKKGDLIDRITTDIDESEIMALLPQHVTHPELLELKWELPDDLLDIMEYEIGIGRLVYHFLLMKFNSQELINEFSSSEKLYYSKVISSPDEMTMCHNIMNIMIPLNKAKLDDLPPFYLGCRCSFIPSSGN
ncbi:SAP domain-containing protein [Brevibacillus fluminis]|uniref:SAP domain-containing protein n=1 Tax=Brevibacillus fluminis TaxID=511487 RepID=UPI003F8997D6